MNTYKKVISIKELQKIMDTAEEVVNKLKGENMKKDWTKKCTCENFQQNEDCEHIGNKVLEEVGLVDIGIKDGCGMPVLMERIDPKNDLYLEPLNFDFIEVSRVSDMYMFQQAINNIIKVLNKITKKL